MITNAYLLVWKSIHDIVNEKSGQVRKQYIWTKPISAINLF